MPSPIDRRTNRLLSLLTDADYEALRPHLKVIELDYRKSLYEAFRPIDFVYFPIDGVASLVNTMEDGSASEVGTIGSEGMVGIPIVLGDTSGLTSVYVQVPGKALRMSADMFRQELERNQSLRRVALRYVHAFFNQVAQSAACAHVHKVEQRCCRWLLMTRDRMPSDEFLLTQEFLAMMLGIRRTSVNAVMTKLQKAKMVRYSRGHVTILDHAGLLRGACECYEVSKMEFDQFLGDTPSTPRTDKANRQVGKAG